jgi:hypothetical protein
VQCQCFDALYKVASAVAPVAVTHKVGSEIISSPVDRNLGTCIEYSSVIVIDWMMDGKKAGGKIRC